MKKTTASEGEKKKPPVPRRKRYEPAAKPKHSLTALKLDVLERIAVCRFLTTTQVCELYGWSVRSSENHLRDLFDMRYVSRMPVTGQSVGKKALLDDDLHYVKPEGIKKLQEHGIIGKTIEPFKLPTRTTIRHDFAIRDVAVRLYRSTLQNLGDYVEHLDFAKQMPISNIIADALFRYRVGEKGTRNAFVEVDRGTERGTGRNASDRWEPKVRAYSDMFADEHRYEVKKVTDGRATAYLLVTAPTPNRVDWILDRLRDTPAGYFTFVAVHDALKTADVYSPIWSTLEGSGRSFIEK